MDFIGGITTPNIDFGLGGIYKALFLVVIFGYLVYALLLTLRARILNDTVHASSNKLVSGMVYIHLLIAVIGSLLAVILVLIG